MHSTQIISPNRFRTIVGAHVTVDNDKNIQDLYRLFCQADDKNHKEFCTYLRTFPRRPPVQQIDDIAAHFGTVHALLDFGCGDGKTALFVSRQLNIPLTQVKGIDVPSVTSVHTYEFVVYGTLAQSTDQSFDSILLLMVLHHLAAEVVSITIQALYAKATAGAVLVVREYNAHTPLLEDAIVIDHFISENTGISDIPDAPLTGRIHLASMNYWIKTISKAGWVPVLTVAHLDSSGLPVFTTSFKK